MNSHAIIEQLENCAASQFCEKTISYRSMCLFTESLFLFYPSDYESIKKKTTALQDDKKRHTQEISRYKRKVRNK